VGQIEARAAHLRGLTSASLQDCVRRIKAQAAAGNLASNTGERTETGEPTDELKIEAAAALQVAAQRALGITLYDEQLLAGLVMARGAIAEMQTGEGKTYAAALPALIRALSGRSVHVATPNSYLAQRDCNLLRPVFETLGVSIGLLPERTPLNAKRAIYECDVVYGTGYEFGFDYLREQLLSANRRSDGLGERYRSRLRAEFQEDASPLLNRARAFAIVDEIDSVLIDEACLPLILAAEDAGDQAHSAAYAAAQEAVASLVPGEDFIVDAAARSVKLTRRGAGRIHAGHGQAPGRKLVRSWSDYVEHALHAQCLLRENIDYVVEDRRVRLVDQYTGRIFADRTWSEGLHQAVEVKEGLSPTAEHHTAASITRQRYFRLYGTMCGMTGTARLSAREFQHFYRLPVVSIPLRKPSRREKLPTRYFSNALAKLRAIVREVAQMRAFGRPVLIGSRTIENSLVLADRLREAGIPFRLLNGKQDDDEATIIAASGQAAAVTIATNMAGRGTDIKLAPGIADRGGLHLIGIERHDSRRIDDQLSGRVGRQGDPGSFRFFVAGTDELIVRNAPDVAERLLGGPEGMVSPELDAAVEALQRRVERRHYAERCQLLAYDRWLDDMRGKLAPA
jgi:preprotein translocase subunit SecA